MGVNRQWQRRIVGLAVIAVLCAGSAIAAAEASAATWSGTTQGKIVRANRLVSGGANWRGSFSFTTDRNGNVRGHAVVAYEPAVDVAGLNNAIGYVKTVGSTALGLLGPFGSAASGAVLGQVVGAGVSFKSAMAIRRGPLRGRLTGDRLTLRWQEKLAGVPYDINFVMASGTEKIGDGTATLRDPFEGAGRRVDGGAVVHSSETPTGDAGDGVTQSVGSYWMAQRVG